VPAGRPDLRRYDALLLDVDRAPEDPDPAREAPDPTPPRAEEE